MGQVLSVTQNRQLCDPGVARPATSESIRPSNAKSTKGLRCNILESNHLLFNTASLGTNACMPVIPRPRMCDTRWTKVSIDTRSAQMAHTRSV